MGSSGAGVYLHYFKDGQPSINWLISTFAGMCGWSLLRRVARAATSAPQRLGWTPTAFGVEKSAEGGAPGWSEGHPLSMP